MRVETLVVTTKQTDHRLPEIMNIQTDAIIGNQCDRNETEEFTYNGHTIRWYSFAERGVGLNRNNVMMRSHADICIFADDDMIFHDGYMQTVIDWFAKYPQADILLFNLDEQNPKRYKTKKVTRVKYSNYGKYGAARIAFRRERVHLKGVFFNLMFGGGAIYSSGEDSIFLHECIKKGLYVLAVPDAIAELTDDRVSTWFSGYSDRFFYDKGVFYGLLYGRKGKLIALYNCFKHRNGRYRSYGWKNAYKKMLEGLHVIYRRA